VANHNQLEDKPEVVLTASNQEDPARSNKAATFSMYELLKKEVCTVLNLPCKAHL
jgi:hypothetical protein